MELLRVLICSLDCLCPLWLAGVITLVLVLQHSTENLTLRWSVQSLFHSVSPYWVTRYTPKLISTKTCTSYVQLIMQRFCLVYHGGNYVPYSFRTGCGFFYVLQQSAMKSCETGLAYIPLILDPRALVFYHVTDDRLSCAKEKSSGLENDIPLIFLIFPLCAQCVCQIDCVA